MGRIEDLAARRRSRRISYLIDGEDGRLSHLAMRKRSRRISNFIGVEGERLSYLGTRSGSRRISHLIDGEAWKIITLGWREGVWMNATCKRKDKPNLNIMKRKFIYNDFFFKSLHSIHIISRLYDFWQILTCCFQEETLWRRKTPILECEEIFVVPIYNENANRFV